MKPRFFRDADELRAWLLENHASATELEIGFYKKGARKKGLTYKEAVDEALCFGWIDGVVHTIDEDRYQQRYTPRKPRSIWSKVNLAKVEALKAAGRMRPEGLAAYEARTPERTGVYSFENEDRALPAEYAARLEGDAKAWAFFSAQAPSYQRACRHWVVTAKKEETRRSRLETLIACSRAGERIPSQRPGQKASKAAPRKAVKASKSVPRKARAPRG